MKYIKTFENHKFKTGNIVKCIDSPSAKLNMYNNFYTIKGQYSEFGDNFLEFEETEDSYWSYRFILATPEESEQYKLKKNINKYNL